MHRRAGDANAVLERLFLRVETGERRQQRRMNVQDSIGKRIEHRLTHESHEAGQADEIDAAAPEHVCERAVVRIAIGVTARAQTSSLESGVARELQATRIGPVGEDDRDRGIQTLPRDRVDDRLEV